MPGSSPPTAATRGRRPRVVRHSRRLKWNCSNAWPTRPSPASSSMDLILWRHADAEPGEPDIGRRLTAKGLKQAERVAAWLDGHLPDTTRILSSPAERAQQTARALKRKFRVVPELGPGAAASEVLAAAGWPDARSGVLIVGHQPTLGEVAATLLAGEPQPWSMRKAGVWWLSNRQRDGST